jgi:hypothetical protein
MTQGKIERRHLSLKSRIPGDLERSVATLRQPPSREPGQSDPADVHFARDKRILTMRREIKRKTNASPKPMNRTLR